MKASEKCLALIKEFESCKLRAYYCPAGVLSIGFGSTENVYDGMVITPAEAFRRLEAHLVPLEAQIAHLVRVPLKQCQFDALCALVYNIGIGNFEHSALLTCLNAGKPDRAADEFLKWNHAAGRVMDGLTRRREAERALFLSPA